MPDIVRWRRVKELFQAALETSAVDRPAFLAGATDDETLRSEVDRLLAAHDAAEDFLSSPIGFDPQGAEEPGPPDARPSRIGPYQILDTIAQGGMGTVYRAVRDDDAFRKVVALKLVRGGRHSDYFERRFRQERRILAGLQHPNIATVLDGGTAEDGQPYLVMECVEGVAITDFCAAQGMGTRERVALFRTVCGAVQYAHQNLVVHRDIKPANVLVDRHGVPKLLDFGLAKLLASSVDPDAAPSATVLPMMTPEYASPEQVRGETVTTASDVYSLGVLLYELLAGERPYEVNAESLPAIVRAVCETEPRPPSDRAGGPRPRPTRAAELRGDLDTIVLKALRKEPERRYRTAHDLSEDLRRHLAGLPVTARADTLGYRAGKFVRRHRTPVAAGVLLLLSLAAGVTMTLRQARRAEEQRARAERRLQDVRRMANSFLFEFHDAIANIPGTTKARELVVRRALEYLDSLAAELEDDGTLRSELASAYEKVGEVQGLPYVASLGDTAGALRSFRRAYAIRVDLLRQTPDDAERMAGACGAGVRLGRVLLAQSEVRAAAERSREFLPICEEAWRRRPNLGVTPEAFRARILAGDVHFRLGDLAAARALFDGVVALAGPSADGATLIAASQALDRLSQISELVGDVPAALRFRRRCIEVDERFVQDNPGNAYYRRGLGDDYALLAVLLSKAGDHAAALAAADTAAGLFEVLSKEDPNDARAALDLAGILMRRGKVMREAGRAEAALATLSQARVRAEDAVRRSPDSTEAMAIAAEALDEIGIGLTQRGRFDEAVPAFQGSLARREAILERDPQFPVILHAIAALHRSLAFAHWRQGSPAEACRSYARALEITKDLRARAVPPVPTPEQIDALSREQAACAGRD
jgi:non-specific serine/threonine protein kinase/serine/threonine-protein kinase